MDLSMNAQIVQRKQSKYRASSFSGQIMCHVSCAVYTVSSFTHLCKWYAKLSEERSHLAAHEQYQVWPRWPLGTVNNEVHTHTTTVDSNTRFRCCDYKNRLAKLVKRLEVGCLTILDQSAYGRSSRLPETIITSK